MIIFGSETLLISGVSSQTDQLAAMPALTMKQSSEERGLSMEPFVVRLGVGPRWWSWCAPRRFRRIDTAVCTTNHITTRYRRQRCGETHRALCQRSSTTSTAASSTTTQQQHSSAQRRLEFWIGETVAPDTDASGVRHGTDGVARLALGGRPVAPTALPRGAFAPRPNRVQRRIRRPARVRRRGAAVQPRRPGPG